MRIDRALETPRFSSTGRDLGNLYEANPSSGRGYSGFDAFPIPHMVSRSITMGGGLVLPQLKNLFSFSKLV